MKITANQSIEVEIDAAQRYHICYDYLCQRFDWSRDYRIEDGQVIHRQIGYTTHSFEFETPLRPANDIDRAMELITKELTTPSYAS